MKPFFELGLRRFTAIGASIAALGTVLAISCSGGSADNAEGTGGAISDTGDAGSPPAEGTGGSPGGGSDAGAPAVAAAGTGGDDAFGGSTGVSNGGGNAGTDAQIGGAGGADLDGGGTEQKFSFFVTSLEAIVRESGSSKGFGGNLGGLAGADDICTRIAESAVPGSGAKGWRAFLSTSKENAISRIGQGPWYDRTGRLVASGIDGLTKNRPDAHAEIVNDLPNETGAPNRAGTGSGNDDNHDVITGSNSKGEWDGGSTCEDWTSTTAKSGPRVGHAWPSPSGQSWIETHKASGCAPSVNLVEMGGSGSGGIGDIGGYGGFYCFALQP